MGTRDLLQLPCRPRTTIDPDSIVCVRVDPDQGIVVIHSDQGFAIPALTVDDDQTANELHASIVEAIAEARAKSTHDLDG